MRSSVTLRAGEVNRLSGDVEAGAAGRGGRLARSLAHGPSYASAMANPQVFVAYPYAIPKAATDYRAVFRRIGKKYGVNFTYADAKITNKQILEKIEEAEFAIFDVTTWNPNVALELGVAMGAEQDYYIVFNPTNVNQGDVPSDLGGIGRLQYRSYAELEEEVSRLMRQQFGAPGEGAGREG
jgi:hypothetical protein